MRVTTLLSTTLSGSIAKSQPSSEPGSDQFGPYSNFNPSMGIVIVVLFCLFFFVGLFSILLRSCSDNSPLYHSSRSLRARGCTPHRGLAQSLIDSFPVLVYSKIMSRVPKNNILECAVCLSEFEDGELLRVLPKCGHVFHSGCIDTWLAWHVTCPVCRSSVEEMNAPETTSLSHEAVVISESARVGRFPRSHSTGHSLGLPEEYMRQLERAASLPGEWSSRKGYKGNFIEDSAVYF